MVESMLTRLVRVGRERSRDADGAMWMAISVVAMLLRSELRQGEPVRRFKVKRGRMMDIRVRDPEV